MSDVPATDGRIDARRLRRWDRGGWVDWLVPTLAAAVWSAALAADAPLATRRSLVFVGGPLLLLAGLHARLTGYLHAPARLRLLVLPLEARLHFHAARARHLRGLALTIVAGTMAVVVAVAARGIDAAAIVPDAGLALDWLVLAAIASGVEPGIAAASAWLGRRFPDDHPAHQLQHRLGGGWTLPEAVVHLYAPAAGVGLAAALAMPAQLAIDRAVDDLPVPAGLLGAAIVAAALALVVLAGAPRVYARGMFEAVPFVAEATRTLAGPPTPEPAPRWVTRLRDPVLRLVVLQFLRETPVPTLRLLVVLGVAAWLGLASAPALGPAAALLAAGAGVWLVPAMTVARGRSLRVRFLAPLPVPPSRRSRVPPLAWALLLAPPAAAVVPFGLRLGGAW